VIGPRARVLPRALVIVTAVAALLAGLVGCSIGSPVDRDRYVNANEAVFEQLPTFPGSSLTTESSSPGRDGEDGPVTSYTTLFLFALPRDATPTAVAAFFKRELRPDSELVDELDGPVLNFRKGDASVSINLESWRAYVLEIAVDHASYRGAAQG